MYKYKASIVKVVDGDTYDFNIELGFHLTAKIRVRLKDYDTPEVRGPEKVRGFLYKNLCIDTLFSAKDIMVETTKTGKYGRWLADVYCDGVNIVEILKTLEE